MASLTALDIVVLLLILLGGLAGLARGFVTEVLSLLAWVAAIMAVRFLYPLGKTVALHLTGNDSGAAILAFASIFLTTFIVFRMIAGELGDRTKSSVVGPVDRVLGLGFGVFKGLIGASILFLIVEFGYDTMEAGAPRPLWLTASRTAPLLEVTSKAMVDFVEKRRHSTAAAPVDEPDSNAGHDPANKHSARERANPGGYDKNDRGALDRLLDSGSKTPL
ncbi:MAG: CvpA family protein [Janthinobacterium lividum]